MKQIKIFILLDEDDAYRPTQAIDLGNGTYKVLPTPDYDPEDEVWEFLPGSIVCCIEAEYKGEKYLRAVEQVG